MSVTTAAVITTRPLNRITELDPIERASWQATVTADASGGAADVTVTLDQNRAFIVLWAALIQVASARHFAVFIDHRLEDGSVAPQLTAGVEGFAVSTTVFSEVWRPTPVLLFGNPSASANTSRITGRASNGGVGEDLTFRGEVLMFDLLTARNAPGALYWPYRQI